MVAAIAGGEDSPASTEQGPMGHGLTSRGHREKDATMMSSPRAVSWTMTETVWGSERRTVVPKKHGGGV